MSKVITIVDCFVSSDSVRDKLKTCLIDLKGAGFDTLLISNTPVDGDIVNLTNYYLYDKENRLFEQEYTNIEKVDFWKGFKDITIHDIVPGVQRHGLSVIVNLFHAIDFARTLGYTHFQRIEVDDLKGPKSLEWMKKVPAFCNKESTDGLFYINERNSILSDVSFHYFYCGIDLFLGLVRRISNENDYRDYIKKMYNNYDFMPVERFLYTSLKRYSGRVFLDDCCSFRNGTEQMKEDFPDTIWNTETTVSNIPKGFDGCTTKLYRIKGTEEFAVISYNYTNSLKTRLIKVQYDNGTEELPQHVLPRFASWSIDRLRKGVLGITVLEGDKIISIEPATEKIDSFVELR